tara:strand:+ start:152 stop:376 length:225 start_codon:yes stop_codon:yes gene_type:complete
MDKQYRIVVSEAQLDTLIQALRLLKETIKEMSHADEDVTKAMSEAYFKLTNATPVENVYDTTTEQTGQTFTSTL